MENKKDDVLEKHLQLRAKYRELFDAVSGLLFQQDPIGINFDANTDEYHPETGTILPRLRHCQSADDVERVVHEEFVRWFDASTAGSPERYREIAAEIWQLVGQHDNRPQSERN